MGGVQRSGVLPYLAPNLCDVGISAIPWVCYQLTGYLSSTHSAERLRIAPTAAAPEFFSFHSRSSTPGLYVFIARILESVVKDTEDNYEDSSSLSGRIFKVAQVAFIVIVAVIILAYSFIHRFSSLVTHLVIS